MNGNVTIQQGDKLLRSMNLERADNKCEMCGTRRDILDNHHLLPKSVYPQHRFKPENTAILCRRKCHNMAENHPTDFANAIEMKPNFTQRIMWVNENTGVGKYPTEIDYEELLSELEG